jgi:Ca-activated chloride channel homolog
MNTKHKAHLSCDGIDESRTEWGLRQGGLCVALVLALLALIISTLRREEETMSQNAPDRLSQLRQELVAAYDPSMPPYTVLRMKEGIERFMITDINNPAGSAKAQSGGGRQERKLNYNAQAGPFRVAVSYQEAGTRYTPPAPAPTPPPAAAPAPAPPQATRYSIPPAVSPPFNTEAYDTITENPYLRAVDKPLSTFSIDVDTASYTNVRRFLQANARPPRDAVRIEEFINYFRYDYAQPEPDTPFSVTVDVADAPWKREHRLVRIGLRGYEPPKDAVPPCNLVFLLDVSGSMSAQNKLPLVKRALRHLVDQLREEDYVGIVVYAGSAGEVLSPTSCEKKNRIYEALDRLQAGGSTNGGQGIRLAYDMVQRQFNPDGVNRVVLCTDGDFNVGMTGRGDLVRYLQDRAKEGTFLSVFGFGMGNLKDGTLEQLADKGNGAYGYIDSFQEAQRVFGRDLTGTLMTIAKDVKIQVEFNPARVNAYRLIGYENRLMAARDFNDDKKDAGEIGAGHTVTALYEVIPAGQPLSMPGMDPLRYQQPQAETQDFVDTPEMLFVKLRYKEPTGLTSRLRTFPVIDPGQGMDEAPPDLKFAAAVALFGGLLRDSPHVGHASFHDVLSLAESALDNDPNGARAEFIELVKSARAVYGHSG